MKIIWIEEHYCNYHHDENCDCPSFMLGKKWRLFGENIEKTGCVVQFHKDSPFYGTWEFAEGGRTGGISDLETCKRRIERELRNWAQDNA